MTTNKAIFNREIFNIPIQREGADIYILYQNIFKNYLLALKKFNGKLKEDLKPNLTVIEEECELLLKTIKLYQRGLPSEAFNSLKNCLDILNEKELLEIQQGDYSTGRDRLYRVRVAQNANLRKEELFHIPFQLREKVATQRYSIPGLPCLYLSDSIYVCWEEMGRPDINQMHVSRYDLTSSKFKLLYLSNNTEIMRKRCFHKSDDGIKINQLVKYLSYWPLLAACSVKVYKSSEVFKPEYIIPQLLLQWIVSVRNLDGVQYKSNRISLSDHNIGTFSNIAIPVKKPKEAGYCPELLKLIKLTSPVSWQLLDISDPNRSFLSKSNKDIDIEVLRKASYIEMIENEKTEYLNSKFGMLERKLETIIASEILK